MATSNYVNLESRGYFPIAATSSAAVALTSAYPQAASAASAWRRSTRQKRWSGASPV